MSELRFGGRCERHLSAKPCAQCATAATHKELATKLRALATGTVEWRVADPDTGGIALWFTHGETPDPEGRCREWLADMRARFPDSAHARKEVVRVVTFSQLEEAALEAAALLDPDDVRLSADQQEQSRGGEQG
jgi:hypothetical protein